MENEKVPRKDFKLNAFSDTGFFYSITKCMNDKYLQKELKSFEASCASFSSLVRKHSVLLAYKDADQFPEDVIRLVKNKYLQGDRQEQYDFAVKQLGSQISVLQEELSKPHYAELVTRFNNARADCLKWFNAQAVEEKTYRVPKWKTYYELKNSFEAVGRGGVVFDFVVEYELIKRKTSDFMKEKMLREPDEQYQKTFKSLQGKVCEIRKPESSGDSTESGNQNPSSDRSEDLTKCEDQETTCKISEDSIKAEKEKENSGSSG